MSIGKMSGEKSQRREEGRSDIQSRTVKRAGKDVDKSNAQAL